MNTVVLLLGSNLGNSKLILDRACDKIRINIGEIICESAVYISEPWGFKHPNNFLNMALVCLTGHKAAQLLDIILKIETELGRIRENNTAKYTARAIDIDIIFYNKEIIHTEKLQIPHPRIHERKFVLEPLCEIIPEYIHPQRKLTVKKLLDICTDNSFVKKL